MIPFLTRFVTDEIYQRIAPHHFARDPSRLVEGGRLEGKGLDVDQCVRDGRWNNSILSEFSAKGAHYAFSRCNCPGRNSNSLGGTLCHVSGAEFAPDLALS
jgi:hypothetical protein